MADMYGAISSNTFTVKDVEKFKAWFEGYHFGDEVELFIREEERYVSFGSYEQYPSAHPRVMDSDGFPEDADLKTFAEELCEHLESGEVFSVTAGGNEKLRYVSFSQHSNTGSASPASLWRWSYTACGFSGARISWK